MAKKPPMIENIEPSFLKKRISKKVFLIGVGVSGKTTIRRWLFNEITSMSNASFQATMDYQRRNQTINSTELTFFDLAGGPAFLDRFTGELAEFIFAKVTTLVFVVDSRELKDIGRVKYYLDHCIEKIDQYSPEATVMIFQHKVDLIPQKMREEVYQTTKDYLLKGITKKIPYYETSIFDSSIVVAMCAFYQATLGYIPNDIIPEPLAR